MNNLPEQIEIRNRYQVIPRVLAFIFKNEKILLIERARKGEFAYGKLNGIGGHIERGESPLSAIRREIKEETGLENLKFKLRIIAFIDIEQDTGVNLFVFSANYVSGKLISSDEGKLCWSNKKELKKLKIVKDLPLLIDMIEESKDNGSVKFLQYEYKHDKLRIELIQ